MDAFLAKSQSITTTDGAKSLLFEIIPSPLASTLEALELATVEHGGQFRKSGEPYIVHPILVAAITAKVSNDEKMVQAALLHDVVEDTEYTIEELSVKFGKDVAHLVEGLTKIVEIKDERDVNSALSFRKMLLASIKDVRVLVIKLCDRVHNMMTLDALDTDKQIRISKETLVVYAPIAHRLGISKLKNHLEDLSFKYIYSDDYNKIDKYITANTQSLTFKLNSFIQKINSMLEKDGLSKSEFEVFGRVKHYYSIYLKMQRKGISIEEVLDLLAIRVILKDPIECYRALGLMHLQFTPLISRFKDYIAVPKENGYKTIHTTIFNEEGIVEAQIRTNEMHQLAEYGIAAHWLYKSDAKDGDVNLEWLESLNYQNESVEEFYELAKSDLFSEDITVFSPKGDFYTLPKDSIALDFAYAIHSEVGSCATGAMVNKQDATLLTMLKNGDIVNIITDNKPHLYCSWFSTVKTSKAQEGIRSSCKLRVKEIDTLTAYSIMSTLFKYNLDDTNKVLQEIGHSESIHKLPNQLDYFKETIHQFADFVGEREVRFWELLKKGYKKPQLKKLEHFDFFTNKPVGKVEFDYCCHPKIGDDIIAFYEGGQAIIHHKLCKNAYNNLTNNDELIFVRWNQKKSAKYRLIVSLQNRKGVLADLLKHLSDLELNVLSIELGIKNSEQAEYCQLEVESLVKNQDDIKTSMANNFILIDIISLDDAYKN